MFGPGFVDRTVYLICYEFKKGKKYIADVDMDADSGSRTRVWTSKPEKAYRFKEEIDAVLVTELFFEDRDVSVSVVAWPVYPHPFMFGYPNV